MFSNKIFIMIALVLVVCLLCSEAAYCMTQVHYVKRVVASKKLELKDGRTVSLAGIAVPPHYESVTKKHVEVLTLNARVIVEPASPKKDSEDCFLYLWGSAKIKPVRGASTAEVKGFRDVRVGFWNVQKGIGVCLNAHLIREGLAFVDESQEFEYKQAYIELQTLAKNQKKGLWAD